MPKPRPTLQDLIASEKDCFTPGEIAGVLRTDPYNINLMAKQRPELLGFPFFFIGSHMKIPKIPFLRRMGVEI